MTCQHLCDILEDVNLQKHCFENPKSRIENPVIISLRVLGLNPSVFTSTDFQRSRETVAQRATGQIGKTLVLYL